jgi:BirA family transcriptional regulator, biotin operon repressor / biotin---[acetyl-CoA-carboxylase] ligase
MTEVDRQAPLPDALARPLAAVIARGEMHPLGTSIVYFPIASSTNDLATRLAEQGHPDGTIVIAGQQTAGRGRGSHGWFSPPGAGLYASVLLSVAPDVETTPDWVRWVTLATGVALAEGLHAASGLPVSIKWPNDLVMAPTGGVRGARKLAGILAEAQTVGSRVSTVVVGFGINVGAASWPPEISARATSIEDELGRPVDAGVVLATSLARVSTWLRRVRGGDTRLLVARWGRLAVGAVGASVEWTRAGAPVRGVTAGIDADGSLLVRAGGTVERVAAGEVSWL